MTVPTGIAGQVKHIRTTVNNRIGFNRALISNRCGSRESARFIGLRYVAAGVKPKTTVL